MNGLDNHVDRDLEEHLRHVLYSVAATSGRAELRMIAEQPHRSRRHQLVGALAALLLLAGASAVAWVASRPDAQRTGSALPGWYQAVAPALPEGFEHVAVTWSNESFVSFQAINPMSPSLLYFTVSRERRGPNPEGTITVEELRSGADPDRPVSLPDGREISVDCQVLTLASVDRMTVPCADVAASQRRALALALAFDVVPQQLPAPAAEVSASESSLAIAVESVTNLRSDGGISRPNWGYAQYSELGDGESPPLLQIRYSAGLVPPLSESERTRRSAGTDGATITWQGLPNGWLMMAITRTPLDPATGGLILDAAAAHKPGPATNATTPPATP